MTTYANTTLPIIDVVPEGCAELATVITVPVAVPDPASIAAADVGATDNRRRFRRWAIAAGGGITAFAGLGLAGYALATSALGAGIADLALKGAGILAAAWYLLTRIHSHRCQCLICGG